MTPEVPNFENGLYVITNRLCENNAALRKDDANEPVRGILPGPVGDENARDIELVSSTSVRVFFGAAHIPHKVGARTPRQWAISHQKRSISAGRWQQSDHSL